VELAGVFDWVVLIPWRNRGRPLNLVVRSTGTRLFFVADRKDLKRIRIEQTLGSEPMIAVLLAAANVEWTIGRTILMFSDSPNMDVRDRLDRTHGLRGYKKLWKLELQSKDIAFPGLANVINEWEEFGKAFELRHKLIHGRGTCTRNMATNPVSRMLWAADDLYSFAESRGVDLNSRPRIRRRKKT
jgi:hypothetical protein